MESSFLSAVILPFALATIMIGIGLELKLSDFRLLFKKPKALFAGILGQMILLPILGIFVGMYLFTFSSPLIAAGFIIITLAPGGSTSNLMSLLAKGDLALSVTLTAFVSVITPIWLPFAAVMVLSNIPQTSSIELDMMQTILQLFVITIVPIAIGMLINAKKHQLSLKLRTPVKIMSSLFLFLIIIALVVKNIDIIKENADTVGLASFVLTILTFSLGYLVGKIFRVTKEQVRSLTFEIGIQNGTLALLITATILKIPEATLAAIFYSLIMFLVGFIVIFLFNMKGTKVKKETIIS